MTSAADEAEDGTYVDGEAEVAGVDTEVVETTELSGTKVEVKTEAPEDGAADAVVAVLNALPLLSTVTVS